MNLLAFKLSTKQKMTLFHFLTHDMSADRAERYMLALEISINTIEQEMRPHHKNPYAIRHAFEATEFSVKDNANHFQRGDNWRNPVLYFGDEMDKMARALLIEDGLIEIPLYWNTRKINVPRMRIYSLDVDVMWVWDDKKTVIDINNPA